MDGSAWAKGRTKRGRRLSLFVVCAFWERRVDSEGMGMGMGEDAEMAEDIGDCGE